MQTQIDDDLYKRVVGYRKCNLKCGRSTYVMEALFESLLSYGQDNRITSSEIVDMAILEFLEKRQIQVPLTLPAA